MTLNGKGSRRNFQSRFLGWGKICILLSLLVTVFLASLIVGMRISVHGREVEAPVLVGMKFDDAKKLFTKTELGLQIAGRRYDPDVPEGAVISQIPGPGVRTKIGTNVRVMVSLGRRTRLVPELKGVSLRAARLLAEQNGYQIGTVSELPETGSQSSVLAQFPLPGSEPLLDDRIDVLVQVPVEKSYVAPSLLGLNLNRVMMFLEENGFESKIYYREVPGKVRGTVVKQYPEPGYPLKSEQVVNLEVAR